jgi:predicted amidohydrolase YtcJ
LNLILKNGKIYVNKDYFVEALYIKDGLIQEIGTNEDVLKNSSQNIIDLQGRTVLPGLNDSHMHLWGTGHSMNSCNLNSAASIDQLVKIGKDFLNKNPSITALSGRGWNQDYFIQGESRLPNRHDLDKISTEIPIVFSRVCGHVYTGNSKAIEIVGADEHTKVDGGEIELGPDGKPNGIFNENAIALIGSAIPNKSDVDMEKDIITAANYAYSVGLTSVQSNDVINNNSEIMFNMIRKVYKEEKIKLKYRHQYNFQDIKDFKNYLETEFINGEYGENVFSFGSLKLYKDGSLGARTAVMLEDYKDAPGNKGVAALTDEQLQELCDLATENGIQVVTHAIGDGAIESVINAYENTMEDGENSLRHGIVHCQITNTEQLKRIANLKILVMYQPIFLDYDINIMESRVGKELATTSYAFNSLFKLGAPISFGTDSPVEDCNPFPNIHCAVNRTTLKNTPIDGYNPREKMELSDAIDVYTIGSAFNQFKEESKGRLLPDYVADLIVLDRDIFSIDPLEIKNVKVLKTMIDGEFVFERE